MKLVKDTDNNNLETKKVSDKEAEEAIKIVLIASSASLSETFFVSRLLLSVSFTNFIAPFYTVNTLN